MGTTAGLKSTQDSQNVPVLLGSVQAPASGSISAGTLTCTIPAVGGETAYLYNLVVTCGGATSATLVSLVVSGLAGGSKTYWLPVPAGVNGGIVPFWVEFDIALPASAPNTAIVATLSAAAGNVHASINLEGFYLDAGVMA